MTMQLIPQDTPEEKIIDLWIANKESEKTRMMYRRHIDLYRRFLNKPIMQTNLFDLQAFQDYLKERKFSENTQKAVVNAIKSYLTFTAKAFLLPINVGSVLKAPKGENTLSQRILTESEVYLMLHMEQNQRNKIILQVLYGSAIRVSELCALQWKDVLERENGVLQLHIHGKGKKQRDILISAEASKALREWRTAEDQREWFVFRAENYHSEHLTSRNIEYIVKLAAKKAGIERWKEVSPHWLRHSHASHALNRNAPLSVVRDTLGHENIKTTNEYVKARPGDSSAQYLPTF